MPKKKYFYFVLQTFEIPDVDRERCDFSTNQWTDWAECKAKTDCELDATQLGWIYRTRIVCNATDDAGKELEQARCANGYTGTTCMDCEDKYDKNTENECQALGKSVF